MKSFYKIIKNILGRVLKLKVFHKLIVGYLAGLKDRKIKIFSKQKNINIFKKIVPFCVRFLRNNRPIYKIAEFQYANYVFFMELDITEHTQCSYFFGRFDEKLLKIITKGGTSFIDVGANCGFYSLFASNFFENVYSFEPTPDTFIRLKNNIVLSKLRNITIYNEALGGECKYVVLRINEYNAGGNSIDEKALSYDGKTRLKIRQNKLDNFIDIFNTRIDFIKIDVEGFEMQVLQGGLVLINKYLPDLFLEISGSPEKVRKILSILPGIYSEQNKHTKKYDFDIFLRGGNR
jgi:FkbM family methyltransferase